MPLSCSRLILNGFIKLKTISQNNTSHRIEEHKREKCKSKYIYKKGKIEGGGAEKKGETERK